MLMCRSMALNNLSKTISAIDSDQTVALLHAPFKGTTLFRRELAKLRTTNKELPLSHTPLSLHLIDLSGKVAPPTGRVAGIEIRVDPPLHPQLLDRPSLELVRPP